MLRSRLLPPLLLLIIAAPALAQAPIAERRLPAEAGYDQRLLDVLGPTHLLREAARETAARIVFRDEHRPRLEALADAYEDDVASARTPREVHAVVNAMLGELRLSHLGLLEGAVWERELANEFQDKPIVRGGCELVLVDGRLHVDGLATGGPAAVAGLREGDEVVTIGGRPALEATTDGRLDPAGHDPGLPGAPGWFLRPDGERPIELGVRRVAGGPVEPVTLRPAPTSLVESCRASARVVETDGLRVGTIRLWHFMSMGVARALRTALQGPLKECDALVLDVRGRGGSQAVVEAVLSTFVGRRATWTKPVVVLTSAGTRSAKEIFAWRWRKADRGPIVGERTQGAVLGCTFKRLTDGSVLMVPVVDVRGVTNGEYLEGTGVAPTVEVAQRPLAYRGGEDSILARGLREAAALARAALQAPTPF